MKHLSLFLIIISISIYSNKDTTKSRGRASDYSIATGKKVMKKMTCCEAARLNAISRSGNFLNSISINGKYSSPSVSFDYSSNGKPSAVKSCISTKNDFEECLIELNAPSEPEILSRNTNGEGWVDNNTYVIISSGKASLNSIAKNSLAMKETTCVESTKLNAVSSMVKEVARSIYGTDEDIHFTIQSPKVWLKSCVSTKNEYEQCKCKIILNEDNLKQKVTDKL